MAVTATDKQTTMYINVETATDTYKNRPLNYVNPELTDEKAYTVTKLFSDLQAHYFNKIVRRNQYTIIEE